MILLKILELMRSAIRNEIMHGGQSPVSEDEIVAVIDTVTIASKQLEDARTFAHNLGKDREKLIRSINLLLAWHEDKDSFKKVREATVQMLAQIDQCTPEYVESVIRRYQMGERP